MKIGKRKLEELNLMDDFLFSLERRGNGSVAC